MFYASPIRTAKGNVPVSMDTNGTVLPSSHSAMQVQRKVQKYPPHWREKSANTGSPSSHYFPSFPLLQFKDVQTLVF